MEYISKSEKETFQIAAVIAEKAKPGDVYLLDGDLGSGKTTFTKGFAKALGIKKEITSPTFVILKKYPLLNTQRKISNLVHIDCYRLNSMVDAESIGLLEYLEEGNNVILVEWPENIIEAFKNYKTNTISFTYKDEKTRIIKTSDK